MKICGVAYCEQSFDALVKQGDLVSDTTEIVKQYLIFTPNLLTGFITDLPMMIKQWWNYQCFAAGSGKYFLPLTQVLNILVLFRPA